jgi:hypothetical protein
VFLEQASPVKKSILFQPMEIIRRRNIRSLDLASPPSIHLNNNSGGFLLIKGVIED